MSKGYNGICVSRGPGGRGFKVDLTGCCNVGTGRCMPGRVRIFAGQDPERVRNDKQLIAYYAAKTKTSLGITIAAFLMQSPREANKARGLRQDRPGYKALVKSWKKEALNVRIEQLQITYTAQNNRL